MAGQAAGLYLYRVYFRPRLQHPSRWKQLWKQLLGFLEALENSALLLVVLGEKHEGKVGGKMQKVEGKIEEKVKLQMHRR